MADKKKFLLRLDEGVYAALEKWAADEFRSVNAQIEFALKDALRRSGRAAPDRAGAEGAIGPREPSAESGE